MRKKKSSLDQSQSSIASDRSRTVRLKLKEPSRDSVCSSNSKFNTNQTHMFEPQLISMNLKINRSSKIELANQLIKISDLESSSPGELSDVADPVNQNKITEE